MVGRSGVITARAFDYFGLLVGASIVALCSGVLATLCVKYELRGLAWFFAAAFFACALVGAYCLGKLL
jgi:ABC-type xylose transport system permease subunit